MKLFDRQSKEPQGGSSKSVAAIIGKDSIVLPVILGGFYVTKNKHRKGYMLSRLLDFNKAGTHIQIYNSKPFAKVPTFAEVQTMQPKIWHAPLDTRSWLNDSEVYALGCWSLTNEDMEGYTMYLEAMGWSNEDIAAQCKELMSLSHGQCFWVKIKNSKETAIVEQVDAPM